MSHRQRKSKSSKKTEDETVKHLIKKIDSNDTIDRKKHKKLERLIENLEKKHKAEGKRKFKEDEFSKVFEAMKKVEPRLLSELNGG